MKALARLAPWIPALTLACLVSVAGNASAEVQLSMQNGRVTLVAKDATVRQILTEWARIGQTKIVNLERIPGGPLTLELNDVTEQQALDVLLRSVSGYVAAPRPTVVPNASFFDRIIVLPSAAQPRTASVAAAPAFVQPTVQRAPQPQLEDDADGERPAANPLVAPPQRPVFATFPQPQVVNPQQGGPSAVPGLIQLPPNTQQAQPVGGPGPYMTNPPPAQTATPAGPALQPSVPAGTQPRPGMIVQPAPQNAQPGFVVQQDR